MDLRGLLGLLGCPCTGHHASPAAHQALATLLPLPSPPPIPHPQARAFYSFQLFKQTVHVEMVSTVVEALFGGKEDQIKTIFSTGGWVQGGGSVGRAGKWEDHFRTISSHGWVQSGAAWAGWVQRAAGHREHSTGGTGR